MVGHSIKPFCISIILLSSLLKVNWVKFIASTIDVSLKWWKKFLSDDLEVSVDFFEYFLALHPLLRDDPTLYCISAWNDNGKRSVIDESSPDLLYRTDFFPGLGWMLTQSVWKELMTKWPLRYQMLQESSVVFQTLYCRGFSSWLHWKIIFHLLYVALSERDGEVNFTHQSMRGTSLPLFITA